MSEIFERIKKQVNSPAQSYDEQMKDSYAKNILSQIRPGKRESMTPTQMSGFDIEKYSPYLGEGFDPTTNIDEQRAQAQSTMGLIGKGVGQFATEAILGMGEAVGYGLDFEEVFNADAQSREGYDNWMANIFRTAKEHIEEEWIPIYQTEQAQTGSFWDRMTDGTWWASQGKTFGTTVALMGPSLLVGAGVTSLSGGLGAGAAATMIGAMASAMFSRKTESAMEANNTFQGEMQKYSQDIAMGKMTEEEARIKAGESAASVFRSNAAMLPVDFLQFATMTKAFAPFKAIAESSRLAKAGVFAGQMASEALEEGYQYVAQEEAIKKVREGVDPFGKGFGERLGTYLEDPEFQSSAFMGALTGGLFEGLGPVSRKIGQKVEEYGVNKAIAANLGDVESFKKLDQSAEGTLISRAIGTNKIDKLVETADAFLEDFKKKENVTPEEVQEVTNKINKLKENALFVKEADELIRANNTEYAKAPELRKQFSLLKYEDKVNNDKIAELGDNRNKLIKNIGTDVRDSAVILNTELKSLELAKEKLNKSNLSNTEKAEELKKLDNQITEKKNALDAALIHINTIPQYEGFSLDKYTSPSIESFFKNEAQLHLLNINKNILRKELAKFSNKTPEEIQKENDAIKDKVKANAAKTVVNNAKSSEEVSKVKDNAKSTTAATQVNNAVKETAKEQPKPFYTSSEKNESSEKTPEQMLEDFEKGLIEPVISDDVPDISSPVQNKPTAEVKFKKWYLPSSKEYGVNSPHLEVEDATEILNVLKKLPLTIEQKALLTKLEESGKITADSVNDLLTTLYSTHFNPKIISTAMENHLTNKQLTAEKADNTELDVDDSNAISEEFSEVIDLEEKNEEITTTGVVLATAPEYQIVGKKTIVSNPYEPIDGPDFSYEFNNDPKSLPKDFEINYEIDFTNSYNSTAIKRDEKGNITNPQDVQILVTTQVKGKRKVLAILTYPKENMSPSDIDILTSLRNTIISEALSSGVTGKFVSSLKHTANRSAGLFRPTNTKNPVTEIPKKHLPDGELVIGLVRENKDVGRFIETPGHPDFTEHNVNRQVGSPVVWLKGINGKLIPARAFAKNFKDIKRDSPDIYQAELKKVRELIGSMSKDNYKENLKTLRKIFHTPVRAKFNKDGSLKSITFTKNKVLLSLRALKDAKVKDKKENTNSYEFLRESIMASMGITSYEEFSKLENAETLFKDNKYARFNFTVDINNTKNKATDATSAYSNEFEAFLGDLIHQIDVDLLNTTTLTKAGRKTKYNSTLKHFMYVNVDLENPFHSPWININTEVSAQTTVSSAASVDKGITSQDSPKESTDSSEGKETDFPSQVSEEDTFNLEDEFTKVDDSELSELEKISGVGSELAELSKMEEETPEGTIEISEEEIAEAKKNIKRINIGQKSNIKTSLVEPQPINPNTVWDKDNEIAWLLKNLPVDDEQLKLEITNTLINVGNGEAWGTFQTNLIRLYEKAKAGTAYHEAFHAVFGMALSKSERSELLKVAKVKYGSQADLEEEMAKDFVPYVQSMSYYGKSLPEKIATFFKRLTAFFKYNLINSNAIEEVYYKINTGKYRNVEFKPADGIVKPSLSYLESKKRTKDIASLMSDILDKKMQSLDNRNKSRLDIIKSLASEGYSGQMILVIEAYNEIVDMWENSGHRNKNTYEDDQFAQTLDKLLNINEDGSVDLGELGRQAVKRFAQTEQLKTTLEGGVTVSEEEMSETDQLVEDTTEEIEHWMIVATELSMKTKLGSKVRSIISRIPIYEKTGKAGRPKAKRNELGFKQYLDFNQAFATLIRELGGQTNSDDMLAALGEFSLFNPDYSELYKRVKSDADLKSKLWNVMQNVLMDYRILNEEKDRATGKKQWIWLSANRQQVTRAIQDEWRDNINDSETNKFFRIDKETSSKEIEKFNKSLERVKNTDASLEERKRVNKSFSEYLTSMGLDISEIELNALLDIELNIRGEKSTMYDQFLKHIDPVVKMILSGKDPVSENLSDIKTVARYIGRLRPDYMESSFRDLNNKTNYAHIQMGYLTKLFSKLKREINRIWDSTMVDNLSAYPGYEFIPWLNKLNNLNFRENFNLSIFKGISPANKSKGIDYADMSSKQLIIARLNAFFNNGKDGYANYMVPTLAGSGTSMFIQADALSEEEAVLDFFRLLRAEYTLIQNVDKVSEVTVLGKKAQEFFLTAEFFTTIKKSQAHYMDLLNSLEVFEKLGSDNKVDEIVNNILQDINDYMNIKSQETLKDLIKRGIVQEKVDEKTQVKTLESPYLDSRLFRDTNDETKKIKAYSSMESFIRSYTFNYIPAKAQILLLGVGNPASYKGTEDLYKRMKQMWTPGTMLDTSATVELDEKQTEAWGETILKVRPNYTFAILKDIEEMSNIVISRGILDVQLDRAKRGEITEEEAYFTAAKFGYYDSVDDKGNPQIERKLSDGTKYAIKSNNITDGQSIVRPKRYMEVLLGLGKLNSSIINEFYKLIIGKDSNLVNTPYKPFVFGHRDINGVRVPYQIKNSESMADPRIYFYTNNGTVEFPTEADRLNGHSKYKSPVLAKLLDYMDRHSYADKNYIDVVHFNSTFKVGATNVGNMDTLDSATIQTLPNEDVLIISETPDHYTDESGLFGVQIRSLSLADIGDDAQFLLPGLSDVSKQFVIDAFQEITAYDLKESFEQVDSLFPDETLSDVEYNKKLAALSKRLTKSLIELNADDDSLYAIAIDESKPRHSFRIPLFDPIHGSLTESLLTSLYKNNIVKQKIKGGNAVMVSSVGLSDELEIHYGIDKNGKKYIEAIDVIMPWWSEKALSEFTDANDIMDVNKIKDKKILELIAYRIPTEDKYSMLPLRVKRFAPRSAGAIVILPREITTLTGADFDIDKLYLMIRETEYYNQSEISKINSYMKNTHLQKLKEGKLTKPMLDSSEYDISSLLDLVDRVGEDGLKPDKLFLYRLFKQGMASGVYSSPREIRNVAYDFMKSPDEQSKKARNNAKIDILWSILTNPDTAGKQTEPGNFAYFEGIVQEIKKLTGYSQNLDILDPTTDIKMFEAAQAADKLIGVFAVENTAHATFQLGNVSLTKPIIFGRDKKGVPVRYSNLSRINIVEETDDSFYGSEVMKEPKRLSRGLSMLLSAIVDDLKHLNSGPANINFFTINVLTLMRRLGFSIKTSLALINQPVIMDLMNTYNEMGGTVDMYNKAYKVVASKYDGSEFKREDLSGKLLWGYMGKTESDFTESGLNKFKQHQFDVLELFNELKETAWDVGTVTKALRADNTHRKASIASNEKFMRNVEKALELKSLTGVKDLFIKAKMKSAFIKYGVKAPDEKLKKIYPFNKPAFKKFKDTIAKNLVGTKELNERQLAFINYQLSSIYASGFEYFNGNKILENGKTEKEQLLKNFPNEFQAIIKKYPELLEDYRLLKILKFKKADNYTPINRIFVSKISNLKPADRAEVKADWLSLLWYNDPNNETKTKEIRAFANNLVKYNYHSFGFTFDDKSLTQFIPLQWRRGLQDSNGLSYTDFLNRILEKSSDNTIFDNILSQFYKHNYKNTYYVPRYERLDSKEEIAKAVEKKTLVIGENKEPLAFKLNAELNEEFITNQKELASFITIDMNDTIYLMQLNKNSVKKTSSGKVISGVYTITNTLGVKNFAHEYDLNAAEKESMFIFNRPDQPKPEIEVSSSFSRISNFQDMIDKLSEKDTGKFLEDMDDVEDSLEEFEKSMSSIDVDKLSDSEIMKSLEAFESQARDKNIQSLKEDFKAGLLDSIIKNGKYDIKSVEDIDGLDDSVIDEIIKNKCKSGGRVKK